MPGPYRYKDDELISDKFYGNKKAVVNLLLSNELLLTELESLKAEDLVSLLFIIEKIAHDDFSELENCPKVKKFFKTSMKNPIISKSIMNRTGKKAVSRCSIS